jgi:hypothetical protein
MTPAINAESSGGHRAQPQKRAGRLGVRPAPDTTDVAQISQQQTLGSRMPLLAAQATVVFQWHFVRIGLYPTARAGIAKRSDPRRNFMQVIGEWSRPKSTTESKSGKCSESGIWISLPISLARPSPKSGDTKMTYRTTHQSQPTLAGLYGTQTATDRVWRCHCALSDK